MRAGRDALPGQRHQLRRQNGALSQPKVGDDATILAGLDQVAVGEQMQAVVLRRTDRADANAEDASAKAAHRLVGVRRDRHVVGALAYLTREPDGHVEVAPAPRPVMTDKYNKKLSLKLHRVSYPNHKKMITD